jgi:PHD/YefM family antitoxin component YafN of YafNO toxin-antitoxin module
VKREPVTIAKDGCPAAVVLAPEDYDGLLATERLVGE